MNKKASLAQKTMNYAPNFAQGGSISDFMQLATCAMYKHCFMLNVIQNQTHLGVVMREKLEILHHFLP